MIRNGTGFVNPPWMCDYIYYEIIILFCQLFHVEQDQANIVCSTWNSPKERFPFRSVLEKIKTVSPY